MVLALTAWAGPVVGEPMPSFQAVSVPEAQTVTVPDEGGDYVVLELIRSIHW